MKTNNKKTTSKTKTNKAKTTPKKKDVEVKENKQQVEPVTNNVAADSQVVEKKEENKNIDISTKVEENKDVQELKEENLNSNEIQTEEIVAPVEEKKIKEKNKIDVKGLSDEQIENKVASETTKAIDEVVNESKDVRNGKPNKKEKKLLFISALVSTLAVLLFIFIPFSKSIKPLDFIGKDISTLSGNSAYSLAIFATFLIVLVIDAYLILNTLIHYEKDDFVDKISRVYNLNFFISILYGLASLASFVVGVINKNGEPTFGIILTAIEVLVLVFNATIKSYFIKDYIFLDKRKLINKDKEEAEIAEIKSFKRPFPSGELLFYVFVFALLPIGTLFLNLFTITATKSSGGTIVLAPSIRGIDFLIKAGTFSNIGNQIVLFALIVLIAVDAVLLISSLLLFFAKRKNFYRLANASLGFNFFFVMFFALYGLYYKIIVAVDIEVMLAWLKDFYTEEIVATIKSTKVDTQTIYIAAAAIALLILALVRNPSRHALAYDQLDDNEIMERRLNAPKLCEETVNEFINDNDLLNLEDKNGKGGGGIANTDEENPLDVNLVEPQHDEDKYLERFDACPAFTEIDGKESLFKAKLEEREKSSFSDVSLPSLTKFIVNYAKNSRLHLSYSKEDIAAFIAGLGCTRLTILQGMSGTGKTSLPKIFMEAINGNCELIEIESSWREKNELLGFYNEFSKMYTPKKFTQCLYKAALNPDVITFIVLDEMNLSRIEYYFSDFLSLMENEEAFRKVKLSNVKLYNIYEGKRHSYKKLEEDHTLKVPTNVWFIGTANRDESTFEISDKVYDRAHTMNFNKRAPAITEFSDPMNQRFLKYKELHKLFAGAIKSYKFDIEGNATIKRVEELLAPFNISFGNRIYKQINEFVRVYCSCFDNPSAHEFDAVETILLTKVVMKLENKNIDNREFLINEFKKLKLTRCVDFISKLSEDF